MKSIYSFILIVSTSIAAFAQVGINNTDPKAILDISSSSVASPTNTDGLLIPRIDDFPATNPTIEQDGMMVFLTGNGVPTKGFYFWNHGTGWLNVEGTAAIDNDWYEIGTTTAPDNINDDQYTLGKLKIGQNSPAYASLDVRDWDVNNYSGIELSRNLISPSPFGQLAGIRSTVTGTSTDNYTSIQAELGGETTVNNHSFYAINTTTPSSGTSYLNYGTFNSNGGTGNLIGNSVGFSTSTITNTGNKTGFRVNIPSSLAGIHYGIYSSVTNATGYAAYLLGRTSLGNSSSNRYIMPALDGTAGQVMTTDGAGNVSFTTPSSTDTQNTLDQAYDEGGPGAGAIITATDGAVRVAGEDGFLVTGTIGTGNTIDAEVTGAGSRMFFNPRKGAFRAGRVTGTQWNDANIGDRSFALGEDVVASSLWDVAMGYQSTASGGVSTAIGSNAIASGLASVAVGDQNTASGDRSLSLGTGSLASSDHAITMGFSAEATNDYATAFGYNTNATGARSMVAGVETQSPSYGETVFGIFNTSYTPNSTTGFNPADRLFVIGNGISGGNRSNALTIYKNGEVNINDAYSMPTADGTINQVLTTDGAGNLSFATVTGDGTGDDWTTTGNAGTDPSINFIGTTDTQDVSFRTNSIEKLRLTQKGQLELINTGNSVFIGENAGNSDDLTDNDNIFIGANSGQNNSFGHDNIVIGKDAMFSGGINDNNLVIGKEALYTYNGMSHFSLAIGNSALREFNSGVGVFGGNFAVGRNALRETQTGYNNMALGSSALLNNISGTSNIAIGNSGTLISNVSGGQNIAIGESALQNVVAGSRNLAIGRSALAAQTGEDNLGIGYFAGFNNTGDGNIYIGSNAGRNATGNNKLYVENSDSNSPLIYGEFDTNVLRSNGEFQIGNPTTTGYAFPIIDGSVNQVLTSDGSGQLSFTSLNTNDLDWYEEGTTTAPDAITDDIYTQGNVGIGNATVSFPLQVETAASLRTVSLLNTDNGLSATGVYNQISESSPSSSGGSTTGIYNGIIRTNQGSITGLSNGFESSVATNSFGYLNGVANSFGNSTSTISAGLLNRFQGTTTDASGIRNIVAGTFANFYGIQSYNIASGLSGNFYGMHNEFNGSTSNGDHYGAYTDFSNTGSGDKYGYYANIATSAGGIHYGLYSNAQNATGYAAYLIGRTSLGTGTTNRYLMPAADGSSGEVLTTDGAGNTSWQTPSTPSLALARITMSTPQSNAGTGWAKINFDTADFDLNGDFNTPTDEFIAPTTGYYRIGGTWRDISHVATDQYGIAVYVNGTRIRATVGAHAGSGVLQRSINSLFALNANDTVELYYYRESAIVLDNSTLGGFFEIEQIR